MPTKLEGHVGRRLEAAEIARERGDLAAHGACGDGSAEAATRVEVEWADATEEDSGVGVRRSSDTIRAAAERQWSRQR